MVVIHIQEANSDQVTEVTARNVSLAMRAYAKNAAFDWSSLQNAVTGFMEKPYTVECITFRLKS